MVRFALALALFTVSASAQQAEPVPAPTAIDTKPLPDMRQLILDLDKNVKAMEAAQENYTYHLHRVVEETDGKSNVKKTTVFDAESFTVQGVRVNRLVAKNGQPLSADDAKKEAERIDKEVGKAKDRRAKAEKKERSTDSRGNDLISASRFLELGRFTNARREMYHDRPTILADYAGDPAAKTRNPAENAIKDLVGTIWIDEADRSLVRGDGHFLKDFKILGGLAFDIRKDTRFSFQSRKINNEAWLPEKIDADGHVRALLFSGFTGRFQMTATDYRKYRATSTIVGSNGAIGPNGEILPEPAGEPAPAPPAPKP